MTIVTQTSRSIFGGLPDAWTEVSDGSGTGVFFRCRTAEPACYIEIGLGRIAGLKRFTSGYRVSPFWMKPVVGSTESDIRSETQWLLAERIDGQFLLLAPLLDEGTRFSLKGGDQLVVAGETGDPELTTEGGLALFAAVGEDPFELIRNSAQAVSARLQRGRLRNEKSVPDFVDLFGWCTWDAFYKAVTAEKVESGLKAFRSGGVEPRLLILDDGWQSVKKMPTGEDRLVALKPNAQFRGDLSPTVRLAKEKFEVKRFLVWHALMGYWGGLDESGLSEYSPRTVARSFGPGILEKGPGWNVGPWGAIVGVPSGGKVDRFYDDYHRDLASQGVDGVKVDNQAMLEAVSRGQGGRVKLAEAFRRALEESAERHFAERLINCMSCTTEVAYLAARSTVMRTSDDFYPEKPESHGSHLFVNAHTGMWFGEFMLPDWDMFQSGHPRGEFHAAARAISGGPVYVSDKPGAHDFSLLRKLVLSDGTVLRADLPGRLTRDTLFTDPRTDPVLLKIFNRNRDCGVVGLFNSQYHEEPETRSTICGMTGPSDVVGLEGEAFVALTHRSGLLWRGDRNLRVSVELSEGEWELVSFAPVRHGFAALGLADKFNSTGAVTRCDWSDGQRCRIELRDGGTFLAWAAREPAVVTCDGEKVKFEYDHGTGRLEAEVPRGGARVIVVEWTESE